MIKREHMLETMLFGKPDHIPLAPGIGRKSTRKAWRRQGLPADVTDYNEYAYQQAGGRLAKATGWMN